jgi:hypothetical protein
MRARPLEIPMPHRLALCLLLILGFSASAAPPPAGDPGYRELDWLDLLTDADREAMLNLPEIDHGSGDEEEAPLSLEDQVANALKQGGEPATPEQQAAQAQWDAVLNNDRVRPDLDRAKVKLPGFIVPLQTAADGRVTEFFLVPYFGACIHVPPPPPNQIVLVRYTKGFPLQDLYAPIWIEGTLRTEVASNELADAAYTLSADRVVLYE